MPSQISNDSTLNIISSLFLSNLSEFDADDEQSNINFNSSNKIRSRRFSMPVTQYGLEISEHSDLEDEKHFEALTPIGGSQHAQLLIPGLKISEKFINLNHFYYSCASSNLSSAHEYSFEGFEDSNFNCVELQTPSEEIEYDRIVVLDLDKTFYDDRKSSLEHMLFLNAEKYSEIYKLSSKKTLWVVNSARCFQIEEKENDKKNQDRLNQRTFPIIAEFEAQTGIKFNLCCLTNDILKLKLKDNPHINRSKAYVTEYLFQRYLNKNGKGNRKAVLHVDDMIANNYPIAALGFRTSLVDENLKFHLYDLKEFVQADLLNLSFLGADENTNALNFSGNRGMRL